MKERKISASLWSADMANLQNAIERVDKYVDSYHFDLMDNHYVPGFLFSSPIIKTLRSFTKKEFEVHLMCENPENLVEELIDAGADVLMFHLNTFTDLMTLIKDTKAKGVKTGVVLNVDEPIELAIPYLAEIDVIVLMGTAIGIKGADFNEVTYEKITKLSKMCEENNVLIQIDGGIRNHTVPKMIQCGGNVITAGSLLFGNDYEEITKWYKNL